MTTKKIVAVLLLAVTSFLLVSYCISLRTQVATREHAISNTELRNLETSIREVGAKVVLFQAQLAQLAVKFEQLPAHHSVAQLPTENHSDVLDRLDVLEQRIENISRDNDVAYLSERARVRDEMTESHRPQPIQQAVYTENPEAKELFETDSGIPLDEHTEEAIAEVFHASDNINMQQIYCKSSVCKITYSKPSNDLHGTVANDESDFTLIDQLSDELGWGDLDVRYARDEQGNDVMYVQQN